MKMCSEVCERECAKPQTTCFFRCIEKQCGELITQRFCERLSKGVEQKSKLQMSSGSWQGWQSWSGSGSISWDEQKVGSANWKNAENKQRDLVKQMHYGSQGPCAHGANLPEKHVE